MRRLIGFCAFFAALHSGAPCFAQAPSAAEEMLRLVPDEMSLCLVVQDLRGHAQKFAKSPWAKMVKESPFAVALMQGSEFRQLAKFEADLSRHLGVTWPQLRDNILGDALVFAYRQGATREQERGVLLLKARDAGLLRKLIEQINDVQKKSGELKELVERKHDGVTYYRRIEKDKDHYYMLQGGVLALSGNEKLLQHVLDMQAKKRRPGPALKQLQRADAVPSKTGQGGALAALWINPRMFDLELTQRAKQAGPVEAFALGQFLGVWKALDGLVLSFTPGQELELAVAVQGRARDLPEPIRSAFTTPVKPSRLWQQFPRDAVVTLAGRVDVPAAIEALAHFVPPAERQKIATAVQAGSAVIGLDIAKDVLPNIGPDWGVCLTAAPDPKDAPHLIAALAVKPGQNDVDKALLRGVLDFTRIAVLAYNLKNTEPIHLKTVRQDKVQVHYLANDKLFPRGVQPAFALKDGYLVLASCPAAIERFRLQKGAAPSGPDAPIARISFSEAAKLLKHHRQTVGAWIAEQNKTSADNAGKLLDGLVAVMSLFDQLTLSQRSGDGQIVWTLRLKAAP